MGFQATIDGGKKEEDPIESFLTGHENIIQTHTYSQ
jgi:hypothetical protein